MGGSVAYQLTIQNPKRIGKLVIISSTYKSTGWLPAALSAAGSDLSRWFLVAAIAGIGMKTQLGELASVGFKPVVLMVGETVFLAALALALLRWAP